jgi:serine/threonine protein kinase
VTESLEPKIYNFKLARYTFGNTTTLQEEINDAVRWLAPEKLISFKSKYTTQCEIYSFGVLLWELAFEKIPYRSLKVDEIKDFVIKGGREVIKFGNSTPEISKLQEDYKKIINDSKYIFSFCNPIYNITKNFLINFLYTSSLEERSARTYFFFENIG